LPGAIILLGLALNLYRSDDEKLDQNGNEHTGGNKGENAVSPFMLRLSEE
jgi:hypothetical protein